MPRPPHDNIIKAMPSPHKSTMAKHQISGAFDSLDSHQLNVAPGAVPGTLASQIFIPTAVDPASIPLPPSTKHKKRNNHNDDKPRDKPRNNQTITTPLTEFALASLAAPIPQWDENELLALPPSLPSMELDFGVPEHLTPSEASLRMGDTASVYPERIREREPEYVPVEDRVAEQSKVRRMEEEKRRGPSNLWEVLTYGGGRGGGGWGCDQFGFEGGGGYIKFRGDFTGEFMHIDRNTKKCYLNTMFKWRVPSHTEEELKAQIYHPILPGWRYARKLVEFDIAIMFTGELVPAERRHRWYKDDKEEDVNNKWLHEGVFGKKRTFKVVIDRGRFDALKEQEAPFELYPKFWLRMTWNKSPVPARKYWKEYEDVVDEKEKIAENHKKMVEAHYKFVEKRRNEKLWYGYSMNKLDKMSACTIL